MTSGEFLTIREMCDAFNVTPRTLRFYEAKELLAPQRVGARRLYTRRDRQRLRVILRNKRYGVSLEDIRQILNLYAADGQNLLQLQRCHDVAKQRLAVMLAERAELDRIISELEAELALGEEMIRDGGAKQELAKPAQ